MVDTTPGQLADMHQSVRASQVHKGPEVGEIADDATSYFPWLQLVKELLATALSPLLDGQALGEDQAVARAIDLDDFELELFIFHTLELGRRLLIITALRHFLALEVQNLGDGDEAANTGDIDN